MRLIKLLKSKHKMEKQEALDRLKAIESETQELRKIIENADKPKNIMERVVDIEGACTELGEDDEDVIVYRILAKTAGIPDHVVAGQELVVEIKALNESKILLSEYFPWFDKTKKPGSGFFLNYFHSREVANVTFSSRLALFNSDLALYAGKQFEKTYYRHFVK